MFKALLLDKTDAGVTATLTDLDEARLPAGDVLLGVEFSTLNYKDGLAITNRAPVVRAWPMVPGIDGAGTVLESSHPDWKPGDRAVLNGWGVGETHWGCLAQRARLKGDWLVPLPAAFTPRQAMAIGTAGYTAMLCVLALERHGVRPGDGDVLVTGATGGVGSVAVALLAKLGHRVTAATGKAAEADYLRRLGAATVIDRAELAALWGVPDDLPATRGRTAVEMFEAAADGAVKLLWIVCTNPAQSLPHQAVVRRALERCEFVIVQEA